MCVSVNNNLFMVNAIGNIAIARSYLAAASWENERNTVMSLLGATQGLGFILGPGVCVCVCVCVCVRVCVCVCVCVCVYVCE